MGLEPFSGYHSTVLCRPWYFDVPPYVTVWESHVSGMKFDFPRFVSPDGMIEPSSRPLLIVVPRGPPTAPFDPKLITKESKACRLH